MKKRKDGLFLVQLSVDGKRLSFYGKTRKEAEAKRNEARRAHEAGLPVQADKQTMKDYLTAWLAGLKLEIGATSHQRYRADVELHLVPALGSIPLTKLSALHLKQLLADKATEGYAPHTLQHLKSVLHHALADALRMNLVQRNVAEQVKPPKVPERPMQVLSEEQARHFLETVKGDRLAALYVLALHTGMRLGELRALRWRDVDLERGTLTVSETMHNLPGGLVSGPPKTPHSHRTIALSQTATLALRARKALANQERLKAGGYWQPLDLVFSDELGKPLYHGTVWRWFKGHLKAAGLPEMRFHDLRHTAATMLLARGINVKVVSEMLGHANINITLQVYSHVLPHMQQQAAAVMDGIFG